MTSPTRTRYSVKYEFPGEGLRKNHLLQKCDIEAFNCFLLHVPVRVFEGEAKGRATCLVWGINLQFFCQTSSSSYFEPSIYFISTEPCLSSFAIPHASTPASGTFLLSSFPPPFHSLLKLKASSLASVQTNPKACITIVTFLSTNCLHGD